MVSNFEFLKKDFPELAELGASAESNALPSLHSSFHQSRREMTNIVPPFSATSLFPIWHFAVLTIYEDVLTLLFRFMPFEGGLS